MSPNSRKVELNPLWLLAIPPATYFFSYLYLAFFHGKLWLWNTVVHEGGTLTLLETTLYASHFLGHIPSLTMIALLFAIWHKIFSQEDKSLSPSVSWLLLTMLFVAACAVGSVAHFGLQETLSYLLLQQQSVTRAESGGSYLLHLPSTLSLILLIPWFFFAAKLVAGKSLCWNSRYANLIVLSPFAVISFALLTTLSLSDVPKSLSDPRYLAHSVRELATFPLTFFPIPVAIWLSRSTNSLGTIHPAARGMLILTALLAIPFLAYQVAIPLQAGISDLAQHPGFTNEPLPVAYLLASHYFEHVLDTIYFSLICFTLIPPRGVNISRRLFV